MRPIRGMTSIVGLSKKVDRLVYSGHALRQMFARSISTKDVRAVVANAECVAEYPDDRPFPSELLVGFSNGRPIHVVFSVDEKNRMGYVVTAYVPDEKLWSDDFKARRST